MSDSEREEAGAAENDVPGAAREGFSAPEGAPQAGAGARAPRDARSGDDVSLDDVPAHAGITLNSDALYAQLTKQIVEDLRTLVFTANIEGHILYANRACAEALSYPPDDLLAMNLFQLVHPNDGDCTRDAFVRVLAGTSLRDVELRLRDRWGTWVHAVVSMRLLRDTRGGPLAISAVGSDISDARRVEEEARARVDLIEEVQRASEILLAEFDVDANIVSWNDACEHFTSISKASAIGRPLAELAAPAHERDAFRSALGAILATNGAERRGDYESCFSPDTIEERCVAWRFVPRRTESKTIDGGLAIGLPTTERRRAERQKGEEREIVDALMALMPDAAFVTDRRGEVIHWSAAMERLAKTPPGGMLAQRPEEHVAWLAKSGYASARASLLDSQIDFYVSPPRQIEGPAGRSSIVVRALPWRTADGKVRGIVVSVADVTEQLRVRGELALTAACSEAVLQLSRECVHTLDGARRVIDVNSAACTLAGASGPAPFLGCRFEGLVAPVSRPTVLAAFETALAGQRVPFTFWLNSTSGNTVEVSAQLVAILDSVGKPSRYVVISREAHDAAN